MPALDIHQILKLLPHRFPLVLVDRVLEVEPDKRILALKNVSMNEPVFSGHFPHYPVMPGVLILEALAQAAAVLSYVSRAGSNDGSSLYYFAGIDQARFKRPVEPGDQLLLEVEAGRQLRNVMRFQGRATVDGNLAAEAELLCALRPLPANVAGGPRKDGP